MAEQEQPQEGAEPQQTAEEPTPQADTQGEQQKPEEPQRAEVPPEVKAALHKANKEAEALRRRLKEFEDRDLSELDKARRDAEDATRQLAEYERTTLRQRVALEKGVPLALVDRLQGSNEEEVAADADSLLALMNRQPAAPRPDPTQGTQPPSPADAADAEYYSFFPDEAPNR